MTLILSRYLVIKITGTNDVPVLNTIVERTVNEDATVIIGTITSTDADNISTAVYTTTSTVAGFTLNANGTYSFDPSNAAYQSLNAGELQTITIPVIVTDDQNAASVSKDLVIKITGTNDVPVLNTIVERTVNEDVTVIIGTITSTDADNISTAVYTTTSTVAGFTLNANGTYSFDPSNAAYQSLNAGELQTITIPVIVTDDQNAASVSKDLVIKITGTNDVPIVSAFDVTTVESSLTDATQELLQTIVTDEDGEVTLNLSTSNSLIVGLFNQVDVESIIKNSILKLLPANYEDNITLDIDTSVAGTVTVNASITGLPDNPFLSVISQANLKLVLLDHLGSAFNLPFENAVYTGEINVSDVDNISDVKLSLDKISSLTLTTTNKYLITIFEELTSLQPNLSYITNLATDLISGNITLSTTASKTITIPTTAVGLLEKAGLLNILLDETVTNGKAEYKVISPLFNFMKAEDSIKVSFDYKVSDGIAADITDTINVSITGSNDTPVAFADKVDTRFAIGATSYEGTLPGSYALNMLKGLTITTDLGALKTNIINDIKTITPPINRANFIS